MLICHKLVVSNEAAILQACHVSDVHETSAVSTMPASWEVVCGWAPHPVLYITSGLSNTINLQWRITTTTIARRSCHTHKNCMHAEQIIIILYIYFLFFPICIYFCFFYFCFHLAPLWPGRQTPSGQSHPKLIGMTGDELCETWRIS